MRPDDLRNALHDHANELTDLAGHGRTDAVHRRVAVVRRRRASLVSGAVVAAVALVAVALVPGFGRTTSGDGETGPAGTGREVSPPAQTEEGLAPLTAHGVTFRSQAAGGRLVGAAIGDPGQRVVRFETVLPEGPLRFSEVCFGVGRGYLTEVTIEGHDTVSSWCNVAKEPDPGRSGKELAGDGDFRLRLWGLDPGDRVEVEVALYRIVDWKRIKAEPARHPDAVIGIGVYEQTR